MNKLEKIVVTKDLIRTPVVELGRPKNKKFGLKALVLNADGFPIAVVGLKQAMGMLYVKNTATELDFYQDQKIHGSNGKQYPIPAVLLLKKMVKRSYRNVPFNRKNILIRDKLTCQYCGQIFPADKLTYDHVIPRSKWKGSGSCTTFENIVCCCVPCNRKKADRTPEQAGMKLRSKPRRPTYAEINLGISPFEKIPKEWKPYINNLNK